MNELWAELKLFSVCLRVWVKIWGMFTHNTSESTVRIEALPRRAGDGWGAMSQQSDPSRLPGPAHTSEALSRSSLSPRCGGTAHESVPGGWHCFREALLRTSPSNGNHSCSCARAHGGLRRRHVGITLVFLGQLRWDGFALYSMYTSQTGCSDWPGPGEVFICFYVWCKRVRWPLTSNVSLQDQRRLPDMCPLSVSPGCLLLCFLLCFCGALPRIPDYRVRDKLGSAMACQEHLAASLLWHFLCVKAPLKSKKGKMWKL